MSNSHRERERERERMQTWCTLLLLNTKNIIKKHQHSPSAYFSRYVIAPSIVALIASKSSFTTF